MPIAEVFGDVEIVCEQAVVPLISARRFLVQFHCWRSTFQCLGTEILRHGRVIRGALITEFRAEARREIAIVPVIALAMPDFPDVLVPVRFGVGMNPILHIRITRPWAGGPVRS